MKQKSKDVEIMDRIKSKLINYGWNQNSAFKSWMERQCL